MNKFGYIYFYYGLFSHIGIILPKGKSRLNKYRNINDLGCANMEFKTKYHAIQLCTGNVSVKQVRKTYTIKVALNSYN